MEPSLGIWKVKTLEGAGADGKPLFQITRNGEPVGEPWIFKGHAVHHKGKMVREEGAAVREKMRAYYAKHGNIVRSK